MMRKRSPIEVSPEIMSGSPVFAGTRVLVTTLFDYLKGGESVGEFLDDFPTVSRDQAVAVLALLGKNLIDATVAGRVAAKKAQTSARSAPRQDRSRNGLGRAQERRATAAGAKRL